MQLICKGLQPFGAGCTLVIHGTNLDKAMGFQGSIDLFDHSGAEAIVANVHHRIEVVGVGTVCFALYGCE
jgi:hypothetical protein